jgi:hypothetical protein
MKRKSNHLAYIRRKLWERFLDSKDPDQRKDYRHLHKAAQDAEEEIDEMIRDAEMQGIRNPAFPDDLVGWLDDDFDFPDERWKRRLGIEDDEDKKDS